MILNPFSWRARTGATPASDHSVALVVFFLLALVFAPVIGLHVALAAFHTPPAANAAADGVVQAPSPKGTRS